MVQRGQLRRGSSQVTSILQNQCMAITLQSGRALEETKITNAKGVQTIAKKDNHMEEAKIEKKILNKDALSKFLPDNPPILQSPLSFP